MQKKEAIEKYLEKFGADGHSIWKADAVFNCGFDFEFVAKYAYDHTSGKHFKEMIFDNHTGEKMDSLFGVYSLDFLYAIASDIGADQSGARSKMGRGFQAGELYTAIKNKLNDLTEIKNQETGEMETIDVADEKSPVWKE